MRGTCFSMKRCCTALRWSVSSSSEYSACTGVLVS
jgi:hypothetical protein